MSRYKPYGEYKDSGTKWLEETPKHWEAKKWAYVTRILTDYTANGSFADLKSNVEYLDHKSHARLIRLTDLRKDLKEAGIWVSEKAYEFLSKSALFGDEFLMANVGAHAGIIYKMPKVGYNCTLAPNMMMAKFTKNVNPQFMHYSANSDEVQSQLHLKATSSSAQPKLNKDDFRNTVFTLPPLPEQKTIAAFLDYETGKIDQLIKKQQDLIALLEEKRQAVISHAVTKGLNPNVPMKNSGVEWLGEVPEHWDIVRIKQLSSIISKGTTPTTMGGEFLTSGVRFLKGENIGKEFNVSKNPEFFISNEVNELLERSKLKANDILVIIAGATTGKSSVMQEALLPANTNQAVSFIRPLKKEYSEFIAHWLSTSFSQSNIWQGAVQAAQPNLSMEDLGNIYIPIPSCEEVTKIISFLKQKVNKFDDLISKAKSAIELMQERRTALISAAVTGKIDVRGWEEKDKGERLKDKREEALS